MTSYYFSGIDRSEFIRLLASEGAAGLVHWRSATQKGMLVAYDRWLNVPLFLDSGFKVKPTDTQYIQIIKEAGWRFDRIANNDVIGDQAQSDMAYDRIAGQLPDNLRSKLLWIYQNGPMDYLKSKADAMRFIGVGGLVPIIHRNVKEAIDRIGTIGQTLSTVDAKAHFFGVSTPQILLEFRNTSWFASADSQTWLTGYKARELIKVDGSRVKSRDLGLILKKSECAAQNIRVTHSWLERDSSIQLGFML